LKAAAAGYRGLGVQPDYDKAGRWFGRSAEENYAPVMVNSAIFWQGERYDETTTRHGSGCEKRLNKVAQRRNRES
jgi:hypothetical protein